MILQQYPTAINGTTLAFSSAITGPIQVTQNYVVIPFDGSIYNLATGYQRSYFGYMPTSN